MGHNWNRTEVLIGGAGLVATVVFGIIPNWDRWFPTRAASATVETIQWQFGQGRLGEGPYPILAVQIANTGSAAIAVSGMTASYALGSTESDANQLGCHDAGFTWMGVPWDAMLDGDDQIEAVSIDIPPGEVISRVVYFEPATVVDADNNGAGSEHRVFSCLEFETVDDQLRQTQVRVPLGWVTFTGSGIVDFVRANDRNNPAQLLGR